MQSWQQDTDNEHQDKSFTIGQVAQITGIHAKSIRYYESIGLLPTQARSANTYRRYSMADINRLILLGRIRSLRVPFSEARTLLRGALDAQCTDIQQELLGLVNVRLVALDQEIAELHHLRHEIKCYEQKLEACHPDENEAFRTCHDMSCIALPNEISERSEHDEHSTEYQQ